MMPKQKKIVKIIAVVIIAWIAIMLTVIVVSNYEPQIGSDNQIHANSNAVLVNAKFTAMAYSSNGFYKHYFNKCDTSCLTVAFGQETTNRYNVGVNAFTMLSSLGYGSITDFDIDQNPSIVNKYSTLILMHNEYETQKAFDAITHHKNVIYLYPNSLYAKIETNYTSKTITLIRGHGYPTKDIVNGFDWKMDNSNIEHVLCNNTNWKFIKVSNGWMLNCYPENIIKTNHKLLETIQELA